MLVYYKKTISFESIFNFYCIYRIYLIVASTYMIFIIVIIIIQYFENNILFSKYNDPQVIKIFTIVGTIYTFSKFCINLTKYYFLFITYLSEMYTFSHVSLIN